MPSPARSWSTGPYHSLRNGRWTPAPKRAGSSRTSCAQMAAVRPTVRDMAEWPCGSPYSIRVETRFSTAPLARSTVSSWRMATMSRSPGWYAISSRWSIFATTSTGESAAAPSGSGASSRSPSHDTNSRPAPAPRHEWTAPRSAWASEAAPRARASQQRREPASARSSGRGPGSSSPRRARASMRSQKPWYLSVPRKKDGASARP
mmetsp:Transcript_45266/g.129246  ORF Transcript_45266/g.129246 Transcript_45266/m.129246 type:complete len:205 (-) Transcript_45266:336-950(-)